jgi:exodeoxyribonuclease VII large subunit
MQKSEGLIRKIISDNRHQLELAYQKAMLIDPNQILQRGYSITTYNGKALKNADTLIPNAIIETRFYNGQIISEVKEIKTEN